VSLTMPVVGIAGFHDRRDRYRASTSWLGRLKIILVVFAPFSAKLFGDRGGFIIGEGACNFLPPRCFGVSDGAGKILLKQGLDLDKLLFEIGSPIDELLCGHSGWLPA
jgi:hypothetical protein